MAGPGDNGDEPPVRPGPLRRLLSIPEYVEAGLAAFFCACLSVIVPTICLLGLTSSVREGDRAGAAVAGFVLLVTLPLAVQCLFLVGRALLYEPFPFGPAAGRHHPRWPSWSRPLISLYWLCHFLVGAMFAHGLHLTAGTSPAYPWVMMALVFAFTAAANVYLVFAIAAFEPRSEWIGRVWRSRFLLDVLVTIGAYFSARFVGP